MLKNLAIALLTVLLCSCSTLQKAKQINAQYFVKQELAKVIADLEVAEPTGLPMRTLYLVDLAGTHSEEFTELAKKAVEGSPEAILIAQLMGDGSTLVKWSKDDRVVAQGYLLLGNWVEAKRMELRDPATNAMIYVAEGDSLRAIKALEHLIVQPDVDRMVRLNGARQLCAIVPDSYLGLKQVMMLTANSWEQFTANTLLDYYAGRQMNYDPKDSRQELFVRMLEVQRSGDKGDLKEVTKMIKQSRGGREQDEEMMRHLREDLLKQELYPEALEVHRLLPNKAQREYPYSLLEEYSEEIALLERYESPEVDYTPPLNTERTSQGEGTFRGRWGNVRNVDNWVMEYSSVSENMVRRKKPTKEQYEELRHHLRSQISTSHSLPIDGQ